MNQKIRKLSRYQSKKKQSNIICIKLDHLRKMTMTKTANI